MEIVQGINRVKIIFDETAKAEEKVGAFYFQNPNVEIIKEYIKPFEDSSGEKCILIYIKYIEKNPVNK